METAVTDPQVVVLAAKLKGEVSWAPFAGFVTAMSDVAAD